MVAHAIQRASPWTNRLLALVAILLAIIVVQNIQFSQNKVALSAGDATALRASSQASDSRVKIENADDSLLPPNYLLLKAPEPKPSVRTTPEEEATIKRNIYGGAGDKAHLGGFTEFDGMGLSNNAFDYMLGPLGIKSVIDVGCGKGVSTSQFKNRGAKVLCVEGSHDAVTQTLLPPELVVEHDFSRGPWWPSETFDAVWCVEFLEHVGRPYMMNYLPIFKKAAVVFLTSSGWDGWHHVEVHAHWWWRARMEAQGFVFSQELTDKIRHVARSGKEGPHDAQHITAGMRVFINPAVASLKQHHHLFSGWGCPNDQSIDNNNGGTECTGLDALPSDYIPLLDCTVDKKEKETSKKDIWKCKPDARATIPHPFTAP